MININYKSPFLNEEEEEEEEEPETPEKKDDKEEGGGIMMKQMEKLFFEKRAVYLWGVVDDKSCKDLVSKLLLLDAHKPGEEIKFYINSPGGVVTSGMVVYDTIKMLNSPVSTICMGMAASMGSILLTAGAKGRRFIYPHGEIMIHQPSLGGYMQGVSTDLEIRAKQIEKTKAMLANIYVESCGQSFEKVMSDFDRDYWMDAEEAIKYGIVDKVMDKL
jgi:ATP-dependent Clp protease, protease subunit